MILTFLNVFDYFGHHNQSITTLELLRLNRPNSNLRQVIPMYVINRQRLALGNENVTSNSKQTNLVIMKMLKIPSYLNSQTFKFNEKLWSPVIICFAHASADKSLYSFGFGNDKGKGFDHM